LKDIKRSLLFPSKTPLRKRRLVKLEDKKKEVIQMEIIFCLFLFWLMNLNTSTLTIFIKVFE